MSSVVTPDMLYQNHPSTNRNPALDLMLDQAFGDQNYPELRELLHDAYFATPPDDSLPWRPRFTEIFETLLTPAFDPHAALRDLRALESEFHINFRFLARLETERLQSMRARQSRR